MAILEKKREEINEQDKWDLTSIYESDDAFAVDYKKVCSNLNDIKKFNPSLIESAKNLFEGIDLYHQKGRELEKLYMYAHLNYDSCTENKTYEKMQRMVENAFRDFSVAAAFIEPLILSVDEKIILNYINESNDLKTYKRYFDEVLKTKKHILNQNEEMILSTLTNVLGQSEDTYSKLTDTDLKLGTIIDENGEEVELSDRNYSLYVGSNNREVRKQAFTTMYKAYSSMINTIASTLTGNVNAQVAMSRIRNFDSAIKASLYNDDIDVSVYDNLIQTVTENMEPLFKYYKLRKEMLGLDELHLYDIYPDLIKQDNNRYTFLEAKQMVMDSLAILGTEYQSILEKAFDERWIDIYSNVSKRSGAYSSGSYDTNPYILLNFQGEIDDVSTLAHELGHSIHSYYSRNNNSYQESSYAIFVAEVASTVNELLLVRHLLATTDDKNMKLNILNRQMELFKATIYRQTMFAEFERDIHAETEKDEVLTSDELNNMYYNLVKKYFPDFMIIDDEIKYEWARIPHFYYNFYVYKYATGLSAAAYIVNKILNKEENAVENYIEFLKQGGRDYPIEELKIAGVDMNDKAVIKSAIDMFEQTINEFNELRGEA